MRDAEIRIALREFRAGMWRAFSIEELIAIETVVDDALRSLRHQEEWADAETVTTLARTVMGVTWVSCREWWLNLQDKLKGENLRDGTRDALVTMATFVPGQSEMRHLFSHVDQDGRVHSVCKTFKATDLARVKSTLGTLTGTRRGTFVHLRLMKNQRGWRKGAWCENCGKEWYAYAHDRWLPPQSPEALNWEPRMWPEDEEDEDPLEPDLQGLEKEISDAFDNEVFSE